MARRETKPASFADAPQTIAFVPPDRARFIRPFNDHSLIAYYEQLAHWHGFVRFLGLPQLKDTPDIPIDRLYVEPHLAPERIDPDKPLKEWPDREPLLQSVLKNPRLVVLGDPGSGKSTLTSWITWRLSSPGTNDWKESLGELVPIPLVLRELQLDANLTVESLLQRFIDHAAGRMLGNVERVIRLLDSGQAFLLLDGLDEIGDREIRHTIRAIAFDFSLRFPSARILMTSRVVGYDEVPFHSIRTMVGSWFYRSPASMTESAVAPPSNRAEQRRILQALENSAWARDDIDPASVGAEGARTAQTTADLLEKLANIGDALAALRYVTPFDDEQLSLFVRNWFTQHETNPTKRDEAIRGLTSGIHDRPGLTRLARTPNLLTMIALIYRIKAELPHGRAFLYEDIVRAYLESIEKYRKLSSTPHAFPDMRRWLAYVGWQMQERRAAHDNPKSLLVERSQLEAWVAEAMARSTLPNDLHRRDARQFVDYVARRAGLMIPRTETLFAFTHLSFQEFFAAVYLLDAVTTMGLDDETEGLPQPSEEHLQRYAGEEVWREPLILLFELASTNSRLPGALAARVFGKEFENLAPESNGKVQGSILDRIALAAQLVIDPHAGLSDQRKSQLMEKGWRLVDFHFDGFMYDSLTQQFTQPILEDQRAPLGLAWSAFAASNSRRLSLDYEGASRHLVNVPTESLRELRVHGSIAEADLDYLTKAPALASLDLSSTQVTDAGLAQLAKSPALTSLNLSNTHVTDAGLAHLTKVPGLTSLDLAGTQVTDAGLIHLAKAPALASLNLSSTQVTDAGLAQLAKSPALASLNLSYTQVTEAGLAHLANAPALVTLNLSGTQVTDTGLAHLANAPALASLDLSNTQVTEAGLAHLAKAPALTSLTLNNTPVTAAGLAYLAKAPALASIDLFNTQVTDAALAHLANAPALANLDLWGTQVTDAGLIHLVKVPALSRLVLLGTQVTDQGVAAFKKQFGRELSVYR